MASKDSNWYKIAIVVGAYVSLYIVLAGENYLNRMVRAELDMNRQFYSQPVADKLEDRANGWFTRMFVDTQVMAHSFDMFIPTDEEMERSAGLDATFGEPLFAWFEGRVRAWWTLVWSTMTRLSSVMLWAPYALLIVTPWVIDGWTQRERRKHTFEFSSPVKQRYALMALFTLPLIFIVVVTAPIAMNPVVTPIMLFATGMLLQTGIANFMKRA